MGCFHCQGCCFQNWRAINPCGPGSGAGSWPEAERQHGWWAAEEAESNVPNANTVMAGGRTSYIKAALPAGSSKHEYNTTCGLTGMRPLTPHLTLQEMRTDSQFSVHASSGTMPPTDVCRADGGLPSSLSVWISFCNGTKSILWMPTNLNALGGPVASGSTSW